MGEKYRREIEREEGRREIEGKGGGEGRERHSDGNILKLN